MECEQEVATLTDGDDLDMDSIAADAEARAEQKELLCASLVDGVDRLQAEVVRLRDALAESEQRRLRQAEMARRSEEQRASIEERAGSALGELKRLQDELAAEQARRAAAEGSGAANLQKGQQSETMLTAARLKCTKLEASARQEAERADAAAEAVAEAAARADAAERRRHAASAAASKAESELDALMAKLETETAARQAVEREAEARRRQLDEATRACGLATDECARVRRRCELLEREVATLKGRLGDELGGGGGVGIDEVFRNLGQMESLVGKMPG